MLKLIISNAEPGTNRAALDAALATDYPAGGFCNYGRLTQDGHLDQCYPLTEVTSPTLNPDMSNVRHSDGSLICYQRTPLTSVASTLKYCLEHHQPIQLIDIELVNIERAAGALEGFIEAHHIETLHVIGPTKQDCMAGYDYMHELISRVIQQYQPLKQCAG